MNWDRIQGKWKQMTGKVKEQWGELTDDDLAQVNGNREQLEGKIQARYGYGKTSEEGDRRLAGAHVGLHAPAVGSRRPQHGAFARSAPCPAFDSNGMMPGGAIGGLTCRKNLSRNYSWRRG
jgi:uncharacterized protein YjbJ (UPF0337 family)